MKTNKIITEDNYNKALKSSEQISFQNTTRYYVNFGTYGVIIVDAKTSKTKVLNGWKDRSYVDICNEMDKLAFD